MKTDIHPTYADATIVCSCGHSVQTRSTKSDLHVEICSNCHPFYTGKQKFIDSGGRMDRFNKRLAAAGSADAAKKPAKGAKVRTFAPAVDPKVLKAKADRAATKAREDADRRKAEEEAAKQAAADAKVAAAAAKAEVAAAAKARAAEAEAAGSNGPEAASPDTAPSEQAVDTTEAAAEPTEPTEASEPADA